MISVRFSGETPWDAIVNHNSLDEEEEEKLLQFCERVHRAPKQLPLEALERLYSAWVSYRARG